MDGFLNIYKPKGITSFDVIRFLRRKSGIKKMGHIGTLDPAAEGVLVVAIGQATKLIEFMMDHDKKYMAEILLGKKSNTYDSEGEITELSSQKPSEKEILKVLKSFLGKIEQIPPAYSAIKISGKRAYDLARAGKEVEMKKRNVVVHSIEMSDYNYPIVVLLIHCGTGTYIRSIANDLGEKLGVGAYLHSLKRTAVDNFTVDESCNMDEIEKNGIEKYIIPIERGVSEISKIHITQQEYTELQNGRFVKKEMPKGVAICAAIFNNTLVGIVENAKDEQLIKFKKQIHLN